MSTTFLNALKLKSATVQTDLANQAKDKQTKASLQAKAIETLFDIDTDVVNGLIRVERVLNRNRLDIYFPQKPTEYVRSLLKTHGFRFNDERVCWYHQDNLQNREFLVRQFNASFSDSAEVPQSTESHDSESAHSQGRVEALQSTGNDPEKDSGDSETWQRFKMQVNALQSELGLDSADLMVTAIDCLYKKTLNIN